MPNVFEELAKFRADRNLNSQSYNDEVFLRKIYEEIFELLGHSTQQCKIKAAQRAKYDAMQSSGLEISPRDKIDALCDIQVFAIEGVEQLGFNNEIAMLETAKEINSREGEIINGKFEKFTDEESKAKWYKARYYLANYSKQTSKAYQDGNINE